ncbi:uncharacterized protein LOC134239091 [Saccostrea cucullata]|uniref:uncharacterized protein LOC134239091 n=1 Tax=Saccostrea cuccullata TaxID=36930 RepID=UPI002ED37E2A
MSLDDLEQAVADNILSNLDKLNTTAGQVLNEPEDIISSLHNQTEGKTECDAVSVEQLCFPGYDCTPTASNYTAECVHKCTTSGLTCRNNGHCYFDTIVQQTACSCQKSLMTIYYGPECEERTGRFEYVVGLSVGITGGLVLIILLTVCCRRISKHEKTDREKYGEYDTEFLKNRFELYELNSEISRKESPEPYTYSGALGVTNKVYEQFGRQRKYISEMYVPKKTLSFPQSPYFNDPGAVENIDTFKNFSIKRPQVFNDPVNDQDSPYYRPQTHQRPYSQI